MRKEDDLISEEILNKIEARLKPLDSISAHVNTHLAHSGNKKSREGKLLEDFDIRDARETLKELKQIADLVGVWFANEGSVGLRTYLGEHDKFDGLDQAIVVGSDMIELEENWNRIDNDVSTWRMTRQEL